MTILINDVADYLEAQGVGTVATNLFCGYLPESPATCISVLDTGGVQPDRYLPTKDPTFQVFIRAVDYPTGKAKLDLVRAKLHQKANINLVTNQTYFYYIMAMSEGGHLGKDELGRDLFSINFLCKTR